MITTTSSQVRPTIHDLAAALGVMPARWKEKNVLVRPQQAWIPSTTRTIS